MKRKLWVCLVMCLVFVIPAAARAQTSSSALVAGTVYDKTGAVVPRATIELKDLSTNTVYTQTSNPVGQYLLSKVAPGTYKVIVTAEGFRTWVQPKLEVEVAKSYTVNATLEVGTITEAVEVTAPVGAELQTTDATVGTSIGGELLHRLPTPDRSVSSLLLLQPTVMPVRGGVGITAGGQVAGARSDQSTFLLDGGDATSDVEGTGAYNTGFVGTPSPVIPVPAESIEEFRVGTTNPNATFGRSQGGQLVMVTKRGTNNLHGSLYWYHQNTVLNANSWDNNRAGIKKPGRKDNRFGFTVGAPMLKDRFWVFGNYEGRRFRRNTTVSRVVGTDSLRRGILRFRDLAGNVVNYDLRTAGIGETPGCGSLGTGRCDPRGKGISPVSQAVWKLLPPGNDFSLGDGFNTTGFKASVPNPISDDLAVVRVDQKIASQWTAFETYRYSRSAQVGLTQIDIGGLTGPGPHAVRRNPLQPRYVAAGVNGQINPHVMSETRVSWYRHWWEWATTSPFPQVPGTAAAVQLAGEGPGDLGTVGSGKLIADPINIDTQQARARLWNGKDTFVSQNLSWLKGQHAFQFGGAFRRQSILHTRTDKVFGGLTTGTIYWLRSTAGGFGSFADIPAAFRPPTCGGTVTTNCLQSGDVDRWNQLYPATLGIVDQAAQIGTRDGQLNPLPLGLPLSANVKIYSVEGYFQDVWRIKPSLTLTLGLAYEVQRPPTEDVGKQTVLIFKDTQQPVRAKEYLQRRAEAARQGQTFNPEFAYSPIRNLAGMKYVTDIKWNAFAPRLAAAWRPSFNNFFFGQGKSVIRGGWSVAYTRMNGVGLVMTPILGVGLAEALNCNGPQFRVDEPPTCAGGNDPTNAFRIGVDGSSIPLPKAKAAQIPFPVKAPFGETLSFLIDPGMLPGYSHSFDLTLQRELPGNLLLEVGYVGRLGRNLPQAVDLNAPAFFAKDPISGQTLAQAFDAVAQQLRAGTAPAEVKPQNFFENTFCPPGTAPCGVTVKVATARSNDFVSGSLSNVALLARDLRTPQPLANLQVLTNNLTTDGGTSDYHAGFITVHKRMSHGLAFDASYTYGHSIDVRGLNQENVFGAATPFDFNVDRSPSLFDRRHVFNANWVYELPFGRGGTFSTGSSVVNKFVGGWYFAGIFTANSGLPLCVLTGGNYGGRQGQVCALPISPQSFTSSVHSGVAGSGGVGTAGNPAKGGSGLNIFTNPEAVFNSFRPPLSSQDGRYGRGAIRGLPRWNMDFSVGKKTSVQGENRVSVLFSFDFLNAFNHVELEDPSLSLRDLARFGVLTSQFGGSDEGPRRIQFGLRVEF